MLTSINPAALSAGASLIVMGLSLAVIAYWLWRGTRPFAGHNASREDEDDGLTLKTGIITTSTATAAAALIAAGIATAWPLA